LTDSTHPSENFNFTLHTHQPVLEIKTEPDLIAGNLSYPTATLGSFSNLPCTFSPTLHLPYTLSSTIPTLYCYIQLPYTPYTAYPVPVCLPYTPQAPSPQPPRSLARSLPAAPVGEKLLSTKRPPSIPRLLTRIQLLPTRDLALGPGRASHRSSDGFPVGGTPGRARGPLLIFRKIHLYGKTKKSTHGHQTPNRRTTLGPL
jgi:hypothetical protein